MQMFVQELEVRTFNFLIKFLKNLPNLLWGGKHSMSNRKEKKEENREGTQTSKHPNGYPKLEVFEKAATKKDDHNHPNSLQRVNYRCENIQMSGNMVKPE